MFWGLFLEVKNLNKERIYFQVVVLGNESELTQYICADQLSPEYGGTLLYSQEEWLHFMQVILDFFIQLPEYN